MIRDIRRNARLRSQKRRSRLLDIALLVRSHHLQPLSRTASASSNGTASNPRCACASRHGGRALCAIPLASADGSARALGARFTCGSPRARGTPCAAASSPRQRKSRTGASDAACPALSDGLAVADGTRGDDGAFVIDAGGGAGAGCDADVLGVTDAGRDTGKGCVPGVVCAAGADCCDAGSGCDNTRRADSAGSKSTKNSASCCRGASGSSSFTTRHSHHAANACKAQTTPTAHQATPRECDADGADGGAPITEENITAARTNARIKAPILPSTRRRQRAVA